ncbi:hypothetical protein O9993_18810 [Vibrio lentus]|nr:hypothetical protein [Vibrio lentus]
MLIDQLLAIRYIDNAGVLTIRHAGQRYLQSHHRDHGIRNVVVTRITGLHRRYAYRQLGVSAYQNHVVLQPYCSSFTVTQ